MTHAAALLHAGEEVAGVGQLLRFGFAIFTLENTFAGFLELDFIDNVTNLTDRQITKLQQDVGAIGGILTKEIKK